MFSTKKWRLMCGVHCMFLGALCVLHIHPDHTPHCRPLLCSPGPQAKPDASGLACASGQRVHAPGRATHCAGAQPDRPSRAVPGSDVPRPRPQVAAGPAVGPLRRHRLLPPAGDAQDAASTGQAVAERVGKQL